MRRLIICQQCKQTKVRYFYPLRDKYSPKFCSPKCHGLSMKGMISIMAGKKHTEKSKRRMRLHCSDQKEENNNNWKGDNVTYLGLHQWAKRNLIKPQTCRNCNQPKALDLANISGGYKRDLSDWEWLCRKCHKKYDKTNPGKPSDIYEKYESGTYSKRKEVLLRD